MKWLIILAILFITGCSTPPVYKSKPIVVEKIGGSSVVVEVHGNLTRIYSSKAKE